MVAQTIHSIINKLNKGNYENQIFVRPLSDTVVLGKAWQTLLKPQMDITNEGPDTFYFIREPGGIYIGAVFDMVYDLHWFIVPKYRGKGHLTCALKQVILPDLFQSRQEQIITIDAGQIGETFFHRSEKVALAVGFEKKEPRYGRCAYILSANQYKNQQLKELEMPGLTGDRIEILRKQINYISKSLWKIQSEVETTLGTSNYSQELKELANKVKSHTWKLEDAWFEWRNNNK